MGFEWVYILSFFDSLSVPQAGSQQDKGQNWAFMTQVPSCLDLNHHSTCHFHPPNPLLFIYFISEQEFSQGQK